jgi:hypothetical protein
MMVMIYRNDCTADLRALHFGITETGGMTLTVNGDLLELVRRVAESNRRNVAELVEEALTTYLRDIEADNWAQRMYFP